MFVAVHLRHFLPLVAIGMLSFTGCVGPMAFNGGGGCGCGTSGPIALGGCDGACNECAQSDDGCGECGGCGELYVDPWVNHPADICDPCDKCGNYNGQSCGKCRSLFAGVASIWGYRCGDCGCGDTTCGGCDSIASIGCDDGCDGCDSCGVPADVVIVTGDPTTAPIVEINPADVPYHPHRERKIFRSRPSVAVGPPKASDY